MILYRQTFFNLIKKIFATKIEFAKPVSTAKTNSIIFFPYQPNMASCGISALIAFKGSNSETHDSDLDQIQKNLLLLRKRGLSSSALSEKDDFKETFLGGDKLLNKVFKSCQELKQENNFCDLFFNLEKKDQLLSIADDIKEFINEQTSNLKKISQLCHLKILKSSHVALKN